MLERVGFALIDYLKNARPKITSQYIFLTTTAPIGKVTKLGNIVNKYLNLAKINTKNKKHGSHALRHSLASEMLNKNISMVTISSFLGHSDLNSTKIYMKVDIKKLRICALEVPNV